MEARAWLVGSKPKKKDDRRAMRKKFEKVKDYWRKHPGEVWPTKL